MKVYGVNTLRQELEYDLSDLTSIRFEIATNRWVEVSLYRAVRDNRIEIRCGNILQVTLCSANSIEVTDAPFK